MISKKGGSSALFRVMAAKGQISSGLLRVFLTLLGRMCGTSHLANGRFQAMQEASEKRQHPRMRALKAARAVIGNGHSTFDCTIRNLSVGGAKVVFESTVPIPHVFDLRFEDGTQHACEVRWRTPKELGVVFIDVQA
ncbi:PilZ domain-containing protein [Rhizobium sp. AAP43]|uniref:PilZ domain-containing protein n=1 Tax=Rhizobium sp. AAP43 TaxID=1523420 RepID=UPI001FDA087E|nr:PilZ domain-containing protein [Rhizobium sp. AAP43]